jgi:hypothetical protein
MPSVMPTFTCVVFLWRFTSGNPVLFLSIDMTGTYNEFVGSVRARRPSGRGILRSGLARRLGGLGRRMSPRRTAPQWQPQLVLDSLIAFSIASRVSPVRF